MARWFLSAALALLACQAGCGSGEGSTGNTESIPSNEPAKLSGPEQEATDQLVAMRAKFRELKKRADAAKPGEGKKLLREMDDLWMPMIDIDDKVKALPKDAQKRLKVIQEECATISTEIEKALEDK